MQLHVRSTGGSLSLKLLPLIKSKAGYLGIIVQLWRTCFLWRARFLWRAWTHAQPMARFWVENPANGLGDTGEAVAPPWGQAVVTIGLVGLAWSGPDQTQQASSEP